MYYLYYTNKQRTNLKLTAMNTNTNTPADLGFEAARKENYAALAEADDQMNMATGHIQEFVDDLNGAELIIDGNITIKTTWTGITSPVMSALVKLATLLENGFSKIGYDMEIHYSNGLQITFEIFEK